MSSELVPAGQVLPPMDPFTVSASLSVVVAFPKSKSSNLPLVWAIAQGAEALGMWDVPGRPMYVAGFAKTPQGATRAAALLNLAAAWSGVMCFASGRVVGDLYKVVEVLKCYQQSCMCSDHRAHCHVIIDDPSAPRMPTFGQKISYARLNFAKEVDGDMVERYVLPCRLMSSCIDFQAGHPSSIVDRIQAVGVDTGCSICPHFDPSAYRSVGHYSRERI